MNIINISTARLAKKKGYKPELKGVFNVYDKNEDLLEYINDFEIVGSEWFFQGCILAPTQTELRQWLIDEHDIHLHIRPCHYVKKKYQLVEVLTPNYIIICGYLGTLTEVIEKGLDTALRVNTNANNTKPKSKFRQILDKEIKKHKQ